MAAPDFQADHLPVAVPGGVLTFVPAKALGTTTSNTVVPSHRVRWAIIRNTGTVNLIVGVTKAAVEASHGDTLLPGQAVKWDNCESTITYSIYNPSGTTAGQFTMTFNEYRGTVDQAPAMTVANSFPQYNAASADAVVPGVSA
jgi:hypothetical protein